MNELEIIGQQFAGRVGRFLEIGANDGEHTSLTAGMIEAGWSGVQVEPEPSSFLRLMEKRGGNPRIELVNAAIAPRSGLKPFWQQLDGGIPGKISLSTLSEQHRSAFESAGVHFRRSYWVNAISIAELLAAFGGPLEWQFVVIDAEGLSVELLELLPLAAMRDTEMICVEHDHKPEYATQLLEQWYQCRAIGVNLIGIRR